MAQTSESPEKVSLSIAISSCTGGLWTNPFSFFRAGCIKTKDLLGFSELTGNCGFRRRKRSDRQYWTKKIEEVICCLKCLFFQNGKIPCSLKGEVVKIVKGYFGE